MKKLFLTLILIATVFCSCEELGKLTQFTLPLSTKVTVPKVLVAGALDISTPVIVTKIDSFMIKNNIEESSIQKITLKSLDLKVNTPIGANFNFLKTINIYLVDGATKVKVASLSPVPENASTSISLNVESVDLKQYILKDSFVLKFEVESDATTSTETEVEVSPKFAIDLKVLGM